MNPVNLKNIEKRTYMSYHQDGLIDIFIGVYVLAFASGIIANTVLELGTWFILPGILPALLVPVWISVKKQVTFPRIGYVKLKASGANKMTALFVGTLVAGVGMFFVFAMASTQSWALSIREVITANSMFFIGAGVLLTACLFGFTLGLKRLCGYGFLAMALFGAAHFIALPLEYILVALGVTIICYGFALLWKFIKKYPKNLGE